MEFALILPLFLILLMGVIEFAFMFNATLAINFASRDASLIAAEAGSQSTADCAILARIERAIGAPLDKTKAATSGIQSVTIYKADRAGNPVAGVETVYDRTGSTACTGFTPSPMPYTLGINGYPMGEAPAGPLRHPLGMHGDHPDGFDRGHDRVPVLPPHTACGTSSSSCPARVAATWTSAGPTSCAWNRSCEPTTTTRRLRWSGRARPARGSSNSP